MVLKWAGMVIQDNGLDYPVALTIKDEVIEVEYPTLGCGGILRPIKFDRGLFQTIEHIERGMGQCEEGIHVVLQARPERRLPGAGVNSHAGYVSSPRAFSCIRRRVSSGESPRPSSQNSFVNAASVVMS